MQAYKHPMVSATTRESNRIIDLTRIFFTRPQKNKKQAKRTLSKEIADYHTHCETMLKDMSKERLTPIEESIIITTIKCCEEEIRAYEDRYKIKL